MLLCYLNLIRSIPAFLMYFRMSDNGLINEDLKKINQPSTYLGLHRALYNKGNCFRNIFYARTVKDYPLLTKISKLLFPPMFGLGIDVVNGIGGGMRIYHGYSTIVFAKSIGKNFSIYQNVTLGRGKEINGNDIPIIGDDVTVYTGAVVIGGIHIGDRAQIGAGAVVVKDVPADTVVVGGSARFLKRKKRNKSSIY